MRELYARANNLATSSFEVGMARTSLFGRTVAAGRYDRRGNVRSIDLTFAKAGGATEFGLALFHKNIDDYLFARLVSSDGKNRFLFHTPADVRFSRIDGQVSHRPDARSRITIFGDYVDARDMELYMRGTNLTDQLAVAHTSFVKDQSPLRGRSVAIGMRHRL